MTAHKPKERTYSEDKLEDFAQRVERRLSRCANGQPYEDGEPVWIDPTKSLESVMDDAEIPRACREEVARRVSCPCCGTRFGLQDEVGYKFPEQVRFESIIEQRGEELKDRLDAFHEHLAKFPYLGLQHPTGRSIERSIARFPTDVISDQTWYRACRIVDGREPTSSDFWPRDPEKVSIGEGRFNHYGQSVFYLSSTPEGAALEVMHDGETRGWVHGFMLRGLDRILDFSLEEHWAERDWPEIAIGILYAGAVERPVERLKGWKPEYFVPRFIADCARGRGMRAIRFKSARHFHNYLVVFEFDGTMIAPVDSPQLVVVRPEQRRVYMEMVPDSEYGPRPDETGDGTERE